MSERGGASVRHRVSVSNAKRYQSFRTSTSLRDRLVCQCFIHFTENVVIVIFGDEMGGGKETLGVPPRVREVDSHEGFL